MPSSYAIVMMILRYLMPATGAYETANPTTSIMDEPSAQDIEYR